MPVLTKKSLAACLVAPVLLAACAPAPAPDLVVVTPDGDACGASQYQSYVGQISPAIELPPGTVMRHYRSGDPVTMDYSAERINFEFDRAGRLVKVSCG
ncbi:MAG: I78 family peptidase inhibitor [Paracoccus sp. (in: a-proteobacteria)]|nr:I78 family peptidase inhibitor [Paracoccus sp. (in: a-proteobacteria)]